MHRGGSGEEAEQHGKRGLEGLVLLDLSEVVVISTMYTIGKI